MTKPRMTTATPQRADPGLTAQSAPMVPPTPGATPGTANAVNATADAAAALARVVALDLAHCDVAVCLASWPKDAPLPAYQRLQITGDLTTMFREVADRLLTGWRRDAAAGDLLARPYDPGARPDADEIEHLDLASDPTLQGQIAALAPLVGVPLFEADARFVGGLRFYVIAAIPAIGDPLYCFRTYTPRKELSRSRGLFAALFHDGQYDTIREPLLLFDQQIDCVARSADLLIANTASFQTMFRFFERLQRAARATLEAVRARVPIQNFDAFARDCEGNPIKLAKLRNIANKPYLAHLTIADIKRVADDYHLPLRVARDPDGREAVLYDPADKWTLLKLLDDDYLWSSLTRLGYEVTGKRELP